MDEQYTPEEYLNNQADIEEQQDLIEDSNEEGSFADVPYKKKSDSLYTLFNKVWRTPDSSKVGNLNSVELGQVGISVRSAQYISLLGKLFHHDIFSAYWRTMGEITLATSASKKGWFVELFVSQKKFSARTAGVISSNQPPQKKKWIFGKSGKLAESQSETP